MAYIPERRTPDPELRLLSLYTLGSIGPCTDLNLLEFMTEYDLMNYFDLMIALNDLCRQGHAARFEQEAAWRYETTQAGRELLSLFSNRIAGSLRDKVDEHAAEWRERIRRERSTGASVRQTERGEYEVTLSLSDNGTSLVSITLSLPTSELARRMADNWKTQSGGVYATIVGLLREREKE